MIELGNALIMSVLIIPVFPLRETHRNSTEIGSKLYEERGVHRRVTNRMFIRLDNRCIEKENHVLLFVLKNECYYYDVNRLCYL